MTLHFGNDGETSLNMKQNSNSTIPNITTSLTHSDVDITENKANDILSQDKQIYLSFKAKHLQRNMQPNVSSLTKQLKDAEQKIAELERILNQNRLNCPQSDLCAKTDNEELKDKVILNTLEIQNHLSKKRKLLSYLNQLLQQIKYVMSVSTINKLKHGTYHKEFNHKSSHNLTAKLQRLKSKETFMGLYSEKLTDNIEVNQLKIENERLQYKVQELESMVLSLEKDKKNLSDVAKSKIEKMKQMKEQINEEKMLLTDSLVQLVEQLIKENQSLRQQSSNAAL